MEWGLSPSDLSNKSIVKSLIEKSFKTELLENSFIKRFIKLKFKIELYLSFMLLGCVQ